MLHHWKNPPELESGFHFTWLDFTHLHFENFLVAAFLGGIDIEVFWVGFVFVSWGKVPIVRSMFEVKWISWQLKLHQFLEFRALGRRMWMGSLFLAPPKKPVSFTIGILTWVRIWDPLHFWFAILKSSEVWKRPRFHKHRFVTFLFFGAQNLELFEPYLKIRAFRNKLVPL